MKNAKDKIRNLNRQSHWLLICLFSITFFSNKACAQYGIKLGTTLSSFYYPGDVPTPYKGFDIDLRPYLGYDVELIQLNPQKPLISPIISIYRRFNLSKRIGLQSEILFTQKGVDFSQADYEKIVYKVKINYLDIALSPNYQFIQKEKISGYLYLGGYGSFRLRAQKMVSTHSEEFEKTTIHTVNNFDWGLHFGNDYRYRINNRFLVFDLRLFLGMRNIFTTPEDWTDIYLETHKTKITGFNLSIGYEF